MKKIGILKEILPGENRVAATPDTITKLQKLECDVYIESGAGLASHIKDSDYTAKGARIEKDARTLLEQVDILFKVNKPILNELDLIKNNSILIAPLSPLQNLDLVKQLNAKKITAFSLDMLPRIARAQSMDILSSMSSIAGYKAVLMAADHLSKLFPMMTTAAGTILPAKVIVIGAGVAGLQAIATARRLGGVVLAFDTRPIVEEQVKSLGAEFVSLETTHEKSEESSGYAKAQSVEFYKHEQEIIQKYSKDADVVITTALIPGQKAPVLITAAMVKEMKPGSVIVDLAAPQEGNCELTEAGKTIVKNDVTIIGILNMASMLSIHSSQLYSKNMLAFFQYIVPQLDKLDLSDEIISGCLITHNGEIMHPLVKSKFSQ